MKEIENVLKLIKNRKEETKMKMLQIENRMKEIRSGRMKIDFTCSIMEYSCGRGRCTRYLIMDAMPAAGRLERQALTLQRRRL